MQKVEEPGAWSLERLPPGRYRMHVSIDEDGTNPRRYPGEYEAQLTFEITDAAPERIVVDLPRLIHLTRPGDNGRSLQGMLRSCTTQPRFDTPRYAWTPEARLDFAWEAIAPGAEYRYTVAAWPCSAPGARREMLKASTGATAVTLTLTPIGDDEQYVFRVEAWKDGRLIGDLYTHDSGAHSWNYRFQVVNASLPRWTYGVAAIGLLIPIVVMARLLSGLERARRRRRMAWLAGGALLLIAIAAIAVNAVQYTRQREQRRLADERAAAEAVHQTRQREFVAAFASAAPRPAWWGEVATPYRVDNVGDLLSAWQGHPHTELGERQFFKSAYQGIVDHPDDEHVVATAIDLMHWVERAYPHRLSLARFGYERYFRHNRRTDNCVNCMVGDTTQAIALSLSQLLRDGGRADEAIAVGRRVIDERSSEISPYKLAETWSELAWAYWRKGDRDEALRVVREGLERYGSTVRSGDLRSALEAFEREGTTADR